VSGARMIFAPFLDSREDHLARLSLADLFLDSFPYNAHSTACDALFSGVPVVTCSGESFASRAAGSLLRAVDLQELITFSLADYRTLVLDLARQPGTLRRIREDLVRNRATHPLFETGRRTRQIEAAYRAMWERHQRGLPPAGLVVPLPPAGKL